MVGAISFFSRRNLFIPDELHHLGQTVRRDVCEFVRRLRAEEASNPHPLFANEAVMQCIVATVYKNGASGRPDVPGQKQTVSRQSLFDA